MPSYATTFNNTPKRLDYLDFTRGIGIISIVIIHHLKIFPHLHLFLSMFAVPLFFILSGFLFEYQKQQRYPFKEFIIKKFLSLMYPYFTFSVLILLWNIFFFRIFTHSDSQTPLWKIAILLFSTFGYRAFWFVPCLFLSLILFSAVRKTKFYHQIFLSIALCLIVVNFCCKYFHNETLPFSDNYVTQYGYRVLISSVFVYFGAVFYQLTEKVDNRLLFFLTFTLSITMFILTLFGKADMGNYDISSVQIGYLCLFYITEIASCYWIILLSKKLTVPLLKPINFLGKYSLIIMFLHMDISVEIAYLILSVFHLNCSTETLSLLVIPLELLILTGIILFINRYCTWLIKMPQKKK